MKLKAKKAKVKLNQWVCLHDYNIAQKVQVSIMFLLTAERYFKSRSRNNGLKYQITTHLL